ncbi:MAG: hypothetical protein AAFN10_09080 [Bacteroidota bacterium]
MKRFFTFSLFGFCLLAQNAYSQTDIAPLSNKTSYEYASIVVEYQSRKQVVHLTDGYYQTNRFEIFSQRETPQFPNPPAPQAKLDSLRPKSNKTVLQSPTAEDRAQLPASEKKRRAQAPGNVRIYTIPTPPISQDSLNKIDDKFKRDAQKANYQIRGRYDNTYLFRMLAAYQADGWEVLEMEFTGSGDDAYDPQILFVVLRRVRQSDKNP